MAYDYTSASDLVSWCKEQKNKANAYRLGGIGRYENGVRIFDCVGLIKCFMWHDYSEKNALMKQLKKARLIRSLKFQD